MNLGYTGLFAKYGQPPGWRYGQWDFRPEWDYYSERESDLEIRFDATHSAWQLGVSPWLVPLQGWHGGELELNAALQRCK